MLRRIARRVRRRLKRLITEMLSPYLEEPTDAPSTVPDSPTAPPVRAQEVQAPEASPPAPVATTADSPAAAATAVETTADAAAEAELDSVVESVIAEAAAAAAAVTPQRTEVMVFGEATPNPNAMKFTATVPVIPSGTLSLTSAEAAEAHPLGRALFALNGVRVVFAVNDFVTVTKEGSADWVALAPAVEGAITTYLETQP